jgi:hypothetical protein
VARVFSAGTWVFENVVFLTAKAITNLPLVIYTHVSELSADIAKADALAIVLALVTTGFILAYEKFFTSPSSAR